MIRGKGFVINDMPDTPSLARLKILTLSYWSLSWFLRLTNWLLMVGPAIALGYWWFARIIHSNR